MPSGGVGADAIRSDSQRYGGGMRLKGTFFCYLVTLVFLLSGTVGTAFSGVPDTIETLAGATYLGPIGVASDAFGNVYIADTGNNKVVMVSATGVPKLTIGTGVAGFTPTAGSSGLNTTVADTTVQLDSPSGVAVDSNGNVYIADTGNHRIHMVIANTATKLISVSSKLYTIAGSGIRTFSGDGTAADVASLDSPVGVAVDSSGNVFVADNGNYRVRKALAAKITTVGAVTTVVPGIISTVAGDGKASTLTAFGLAISPLPAGDLYISDSGNHRIFKMTAAKGVPAIFAGTGTSGFFGDGGLATLAQFNQPSGIAVDGKDLYVADTMNNCIRKISLPTGIISTRAGSMVQAAAVVPVLPVLPLSFPQGVAVSSTGSVYIAEWGNSLIDQVFAPVSAITTVSPPGGTYATSQTVTITASKAATTSYKINGGIATQYSSPFVISGPGTSTLTFTSLDIAGHQEVTNSATYVFDTIAPVTTALINAVPVNGTIYSAQSSLAVTLTSNTPGSSIYFTTTGTVPTAISAYLYSAPVTLPVTSTLTTTNVQFFAVDAVGNKEIVQSQKYSVVAIASSASPAGGAYRSAQLVTLAANDPVAAIHFTLDGSTPTVASPQYNPATHITIAANSTLKFRAIDAAGNLEQTRTQVYTIDSIAPTTTVTPAGSSFSSPQTVTLAPDDLGATIYYSLNGIAPTTSSTRYSVPLLISTTTTLMYFAMDAAGNRESVKTEVYTIDSVAPVTTASVPGGTYAFFQSVTLSSNDPTASIYFTTDGTAPTPLSIRYMVPILVSNSMKLRYFGMDVAGNKEAVKEQDYTIIVLTTEASPPGGVFTSLQTVALATNGVKATIYYSIDGSDPAITSKTTFKYTVPIFMTNPSTVLKFFAVDEKGIIESFKTETYAVDNVPPVTTAACGTAATGDTITLAAADLVDPLVFNIKYIANTITNGGLTPAYTLTDYTVPASYAANTIVKYFAIDAAGNVEAIKSASCNTVVPDVNPSLYLETLPDGATTSNSTLFITGNVAPPTALLTVNGVVVTVNTIDGSFNHQITTPALASGANLITTTVTDGALTTTDTRTITYAAPGTTPTSIGIGSSNGVAGYVVRVPITFSSGYQAAAVSLDVDYNTVPALENPKIEITEMAAAAGKIINGGIVNPGVYRFLIMDKPVSGGIVSPLPDGIIAYLSYTTPFPSTAANGALTASQFSATDLFATSLTVLPPVNGLVNIVSKPGNSIGTFAGDNPVTLKGVQDAYYMLLDPVAHPADGSADTNADGFVQIYELQQVINSFLGL
jgi:sugar lactone lactonase YvrE